MTELVRKLLKDIEKTGFPSELQVADIFISQGWVGEESLYFIDQDEQKGREIDLSIHTSCSTKTEPYIFVWTMLSVEIKKSEKPWVIFTSDKRITDSIGRYAILHHLNNVDSKILPSKEVGQSHPSSSEPRIGRNCCVGFNNGNNQAIYRSLLTATKACIENHRLASSHKEAYDDNSYDVVFYTPVVVFDGNLFESHLNNEGEVVITEVNLIPYRFNYASPSYAHRSNLFDIVTIEHLSRYLEAHRRWIEHMHKTVEVNIKSS